MNKAFVAFAKAANEIVKAMVPSVAGVEDAIVGLKKGADKKAAVIAIAKNALMAAEGVSQKDIVNQAKFESGLDKLNDGLADLIEAFKQPA